MFSLKTQCSTFLRNPPPFFFATWNVPSSRQSSLVSCSRGNILKTLTPSLLYFFYDKVTIFFFAVFCFHVAMICSKAEAVGYYFFGLAVLCSFLCSKAKAPYALCEVVRKKSCIGRIAQLYLLVHVLSCWGEQCSVCMCVVCFVVNTWHNNTEWVSAKRRGEYNVISNLPSHSLRFSPSSE